MTALVIAEPTGRYRRVLRRYGRDSHGSCPAHGYHDASAVIGEIPAAEADAHGDNWPHDDPRWPARCDCGYEFISCPCGQADCPTDDNWQRNDNRVYRLPGGAEFAWWGDVGKVAPPGTMVRADWYPGGDRGESWLVVLPDGTPWITTQPASGGGYWTVTGTPPRITVTPSIASPGWHGFIRDGELVPA